MLWHLLLSFAATVPVFYCGGKKKNQTTKDMAAKTPTKAKSTRKKTEKTETETGMTGTGTVIGTGTGYADDKKSDKVKKPSPVQDKDQFEKPEDEDKKVKAKDPAYETLNGMNNENVFGKNKKKEKFKAPTKVAKADAKDPAYETLNGMGNEVFGEGEEDTKDKKKTANTQQQTGEEKKDVKKQQPKKDFKAPEQVKKADAKDPAYETLNGMGSELFADDAKTQQSVQLSAAHKA